MGVTESDTERPMTLKDFYYLYFPRGRCTPLHTPATVENTRLGQEAERARGKPGPGFFHGKSLFCIFHWKGRARESLQLASVNNAGRLRLAAWSLSGTWPLGD